MHWQTVFIFVNVFTTLSILYSRMSGTIPTGVVLFTAISVILDHCVHLITVESTDDIVKTRITIRLVDVYILLVFTFTISVTLSCYL